MNWRIGRQPTGKFDDWIEWLVEMERVLTAWKDTGRADGLVRLLCRQEVIIAMNSLTNWFVPHHLLGIVNYHAETIASTVNSVVLILERGITAADHEQLCVFTEQLAGVRRWLRAHNGPSDSGIKY